MLLPAEHPIMAELINIVFVVAGVGVVASTRLQAECNGAFACPPK